MYFGCVCNLSRVVSQALIGDISYIDNPSLSPFIIIDLPFNSTSREISRYNYKLVLNQKIELDLHNTFLDWEASLTPNYNWSLGPYSLLVDVPNQKGGYTLSKLVNFEINSTASVCDSSSIIKYFDSFKRNDSKPIMAFPTLLNNKYVKESGVKFLADEAYQTVPDADKLELYRDGLYLGMGMLFVFDFMLYMVDFNERDNQWQDGQEITHYVGFLLVTHNQVQLLEWFGPGDVST